MEYQSVVIGGCGGAGAGGDGKDDRNKRPFSKVGGGLNNVNDPPTLTCPRCHSTKTKYYYYNNHSLSQPRYYCKGCRRHWTHGGTLRDVPEGGRRRQSKRSRPFESSVAVSATNTASLPQQPLSAMPFFLAVPQPVVFPNNGNMWNFSHQNDVNSSSSLMPPSPLTLSSNTMLNNSLLRGFDEIPIPTYNFMNFYEPAPAEPVLGDLLNVGNDILPLLPPQPEVDDNDDNKNNNNNNNNMGTGGFDEA